MTILGAMLAMLVANHALFAAGVWPWGLWLAVAAFAGVTLRFAVRPLVPDTPLGRPDAGALTLGLIALLPQTALIVATWNREFGFGGDASFHIGVAFRLLFWWLSPPFAATSETLDAGALEALRAAPWRLAISRLALIVVATAALIGLARRNARLALALATILLLAWGGFESAREYRYPGLAYLGAFPFALPAFFLGVPELAFRLGNLVALAAWLFALRPMLLRRWPDPPVLAAAVFCFWAEPSLIFLDAAYLEAWCLVFLLLAVETRMRRGADGAALACLLVGFAAAAKEGAIFLLPFFWLSASPWRDFAARGRDVTLAAIASGLPFVAFFVANHAFGLARTVSFGAPDSMTAAAFAETARRVLSAGSGSLTIALLLGVVLLSVARDRKAALAMAGGAFFLVAFFHVERGSAGYAGVLRYFLPVLPLLAAGFFVNDAAPRRALAAILIVQTFALGAVATRALGPAEARGFAEYYDAPFVFPIKAAITQAGPIPDSRIVVLRPDAVLVPGAAMGRQGAALDFVDDGDCACSSTRPAVMALAPAAAGYAVDDLSDAAPAPRAFGPEIARIERWRAARDAMPACREAMARACARVIERRYDDRATLLLGIR